MLIALQKAIKSSDIAFMRATLKDFIRDRAEALIMDAAYFYADNEWSAIDADEIVANIEYAITYLLLLGDDIDAIKARITSEFVEYGWNEDEPLTALWEETEEGYAAWLTD